MRRVYKDQLHYTKGFTLVELLIAISLIGVLTGVLLAVLNPRGIQAKARDAQRVADLAKVKVALENYYSDNRVYPTANAWVAITTLSGAAVVPRPLNAAYITKLPEDPKKTGTLCGGGTWRGYGYKSVGGTAYILATNMEIAASASSGCPSGIAGAWCNCTFGGATGYYTTAD
jgi:prepilin-type N-terminal cleavage/methylation domain-containing protein